MFIAESRGCNVFTEGILSAALFLFYHKTMKIRFHYLHVQNAMKHLPKTTRMLRGNGTDKKRK